MDNNLVIGFLAGSFLLNFIAFSALMKMNRNIAKLCGVMMRFKDMMQLQEELCQHRHGAKNAGEIQELMDKIFGKGKEKFDEG